jgi:hypothetical protein
LGLSDLEERSLFPINLLNDGMQSLVKYGASQA